MTTLAAVVDTLRVSDCRPYLRKESSTPVSENRTGIAVIGLGAMGLPMATHLATAFSVTGFDPFGRVASSPQRARHRGRGTPAAASKNADIALLAVRDQGQAESALFDKDGVLSL